MICTPLVSVRSTTRVDLLRDARTGTRVVEQPFARTEASLTHRHA